MIIGLTGKAGAGKSTVAAHLEDRFGFVRVRFADPLKRMMRALGLSEDHIEGDLKELPCDLLGGHSPRWAMQTLGTEWGRVCIGPDIWVRAWFEAAMWHTNVVAEDVRFINEVAKVREAGGHIINIDRPEFDPIPGSDHASECGIEGTRPDVTITNDGTVDKLHADVRAVLRSLN